MIAGLMRVKNETRWIERAVRSILPLCDSVLIFDDHSTDDTPKICRGIDRRVLVVKSPFEGCDEARDKNYMLAHLGDSCDWVVMIDGDEELAPGGVEILQEAMRRPSRSISMEVLYLWDRPDQVRVDGVYGEFLRQSVFRPDPRHRFEGGPPPSFHCGNVPSSMRFPYYRSAATLLHYGYLHASDRVRKYRWYNQVDPDNHREDCYRHMVIGDLMPADQKRVHGGPLKLVPLSERLKG